MDFSTKYMGLNLSSPIIAASSPMTAGIDSIKALEKSGAGAVVLKSLFEEQIIRDKVNPAEVVGFQEHPEASEYIDQMGRVLHGPREYLQLIRRVVNQVKIPVIASLNCQESGEWVGFAKEIEAAGAHALELNLCFFAGEPEEDGAKIEEKYLQVIGDVKKQLSIPLAIKIGASFSSLGNFLTKAASAGAQAATLFNRYYPFNIDIKNQKILGTNTLSQGVELGEGLRWIANLSGRVGLDLAGNKGIQNAQDVIRFLMAGASSVQVASCILRKGPGYIETMLGEIRDYLASRKMSAISEFQGELSRQATGNGREYERLQYISALSVSWENK